ncbi:MAG TPA: flagellar biosynthesis anti-sigma factor FlgM [Candidatus Saccharimonadales bacterium]|nr:flagellar biosynthesis anti-sigma factor FlgM [Candidatus Saccharimonadales bacterium]
MDLRIQNQGQPDIDPASNLKSGSAQAGSVNGTSLHNSLAALNTAQDTASISGATVQLSGDAAIRQDRVDALRSQLEGGTYTLDSHAIATAMFQNLFRS